ncbi:hypothetical protein [Azospirillum sp. B506]|uniref:AbiU2 domain-containing protein n=1 Tax=Azospirillum sp. B506 TaxID=137721 RepID=UPI0011DE2A17|nr:hypothetical protein [Azospirillum sp. B506]
MNERNAEDSRLSYVDLMGEELGNVYSALWQEVASVHRKWNEFVHLFGSRESRVGLLNEAAAHFFGMIQGVLWEDIILHLARITDPAVTLKTKKNLSIQGISGLIPDAKLRECVQNRVDVAVAASSFCRDWRNRHLAHRDLDLSLERAATPLEPVDRTMVKAALKAVADVMNAVSGHYEDSETAFHLGISHSGAEALLYVLDEGLRVERQRMERISTGTFTSEDIEFHRRDI